MGSKTLHFVVLCGCLVLYVVTQPHPCTNCYPSPSCSQRQVVVFNLFGSGKSASVMEAHQR